MIRNIIFDLGGVLVDFKPQNYLSHIGLNKEEVEFFTKLVFYGKEWREYNSSKINSKQTEEKLIKEYSEYANIITKIFNKLDYNYILFEMKDTAEYLKELKAKGYNIYILSDLNEDSFKYNKQFDFFNYVSGGVYSFEVGTTKPNRNNYETLLKKYNLLPEESIFIDDNIDNVNMANELGINGIQFVALDIVKKQIEKLEESQ